jgi:hypothetical protein
MVIKRSYMTRVPMPVQSARRTGLLRPWNRHTSARPLIWQALQIVVNPGTCTGLTLPYDQAEA